MLGGQSLGRRTVRAAGAAVLAYALVLVLAGSAWAVTRYAAPGGTATPAACTSPSGPYCSIFDAAGGAGVGLADEAVILPGNYSDTAGDLGGTNSVTQLAGNVHGLAGQPRPVITLNVDGGQSASGAFRLNGTHALSYVEIQSSVSWHNFTLAGGGLVDRVISRNTRFENGIACTHRAGLIRNSACLATGTSSRGAGDRVINPPGSLGLVNVTASGQSGLSYGAAGAGTVTINASSVIAIGIGAPPFEDVRGSAASGAVLNFNLDFSNYGDVGEVETGGGTSNVTLVGADADNQTAVPLLAADGFHQQPTSPTVGAGEANHPFVGGLDIDGQSREIPNDDPDIGADELAHPSATAVACSPGSPTLGASSTCTATVTDTAPAGQIAPTGNVNFASGGSGSFSGGGACTLSAVSASASSCQVSYTPGQLGAHQITALFPTGGAHEASQSSTGLTAVAPLAAAEDPQCEVLRSKLAKLNRRIRQADDPDQKAKLRKKRRKVRRQLRDLGCAV